MLTTSDQIGGHADVLRMILDGADRYAAGNAAHERDSGAALRIGRRRYGQLRLPAAAALDHARAETSALRSSVRHRLRKLDDLDGASAMRQATDEAALFERDDQSVHTRLGLQSERIFHFVEGGGNPGLLQAGVDEDEQLFLLFRKHGRSKILSIDEFATRPAHRTNREHHRCSRDVLQVATLLAGIRNPSIKNPRAGSTPGHPRARPPPPPVE